MNWYLLALSKYAVVSGRSRRKEYWMFVLINLLINVVLMLVDRMTNLYSESWEVGLLSGVYSLFVLIPSVTLMIRRLHDSGRSGWWFLLVLLPVIGTIMLFIFAILDSSPGANEYGPNPKEFV
ncbi:DUF805 domain-containing protein [Alteromonas pelagimontana]|uniref:DUF805 domain-containing protein n=1 Tax=Alteromonas pelagimontana TaxID=1858656 RepID=A0A6M4MF74_9ALTE|nr:DUF805 domain-containing protein [Alteromonas pelagimontana]QJR81265.1 DUF805 domain-containing protein [Alteromonas pelagimontana]